jgi:hypothetical protein
LLHHYERRDGAVIEPEQRGADELLTVSESAAERAEYEAPVAGRSPETVDRIMVGACGAIWLVLLAASVLAVVAMVRLASGHPSGAERHSSWLLYSIIVISALIIAGAIPLLLRARRNALAGPDDSGAAEAQLRAPVQPVDASTENVRVFGVDPYAQPVPDVVTAAPAIPAPVLDRIWLRGTTSLLSAIGLALTAVAAATYLLADGDDTAAWVGLGLAGVITIAMPAVLVFHQRMLSEAMGE